MIFWKPMLKKKKKFHTNSYFFDFSYKNGWSGKNGIFCGFSIILEGIELK